MPNGDAGKHNDQTSPAPVRSAMAGAGTTEAVGEPGPEKPVSHPIEVEAPETYGGKPRGRAAESVKTPSLFRARQMPLRGPEVLSLLFRLGVMTAEQIAALLSTPLSRFQVYAILRSLGSQEESQQESSPPNQPGMRNRRAKRLVEAWRRPCLYTKDPKTPAWRNVYYLTGAGLDYVARHKDIYPTVAESLYRRVLEEARIDHALLRNEYYRRLATELQSRGASGNQPAERTSQGSTHPALANPTLQGVWAESGRKPIELERVREDRRRYLNYDGFFELDLPGSSGGLRRFYIEADTGSEDMDWQVTGHAEKYAEHFLQVLESEIESEDMPTGSTTSDVLPRVVFVSPVPSRTRWVRRVVRAKGLEEKSVFSAVRAAFRTRGYKLPELFWFTNQEWLDAEGTLGSSYWPLSSSELEPLI